MLPDLKNIGDSAVILVVNPSTQYWNDVLIIKVPSFDIKLDVSYKGKNILADILCLFEE